MRDEQRRGLIGLVIGVVVLLLSKFVMDVPNGNIVQSLFPALAAGLTAVALVLMYRTARIINFAQIALGALTSQLFFQLYANKGILPYGAALVVSILGGVIIGLLVGTLATMLFFKHPRLVMTVVTILMIQLLSDIQGRVNGIFVEPGETQSPVTIFGPWQNSTIELDGIPFRFIHGLSLFMLAGLAIGLVIFFRRTRFGTALRASAENADRASLLGINVKALNVAVWVIVAVISSVAQLSRMAIDQYNPTAFFDQTALLLPLAAAVVARMQSMPTAFFVGTGLVVLERSIQYATNESALIQIGLFGLLMVALLLQRRKLSARAEEATSWKATKEPRPTPRELLAIPGIARARRIGYAVLILLVLGLPWIVSIPRVVTLQQVPLLGIIGASLVILTGWTGQISLGQFAIVTAGAFVGGWTSLNWGIPFLITLPLGGIAGALFALLIGIPALRIRGLFLAVSTFSVAIIVPLLMTDSRFLGDIVPTEGLSRPKLFFLDFEDQRAYYYLLLIFFGLTVASVQALRKSRAGRVLIALRDNEDGVRAFGIDAVRTRLYAFALSGFIAGAGGALLANQSLGVDPAVFNFGQSINLFILVVIGGVSSVLGAVLGASFFIIGAIFFPSLLTLITGVFGLVVLMFIPGGLVQIVFGVRDAILRVVAMRQHIVVPSLFEDYSPDAWEKRQAPLSQPVQSHGLAALRHDQRYSLPSRLYGGASS